MLKIRPLQLRALDALGDDRLRDHIAEHLGEHHPDAIARLTTKELRRRIGIAIRRARERGMTWQSSITIFAALMFAIGPGFDTHPFVRDVLDDDELDPDQRMKLLPARLAPSLWRMLQEQYRGGTWEA